MKTTTSKPNPRHCRFFFEDVFDKIYTIIYGVREKNRIETKIRYSHQTTLAHNTLLQRDFRSDYGNNITNLPFAHQISHLACTYTKPFLPLNLNLSHFYFLFCIFSQFEQWEIRLYHIINYIITENFAICYSTIFSFSLSKLTVWKFES